MTLSTYKKIPLKLVARKDLVTSCLGEPPVLLHPLIRVGPYKEVGFKPPSARFFFPRKYLASSRGEGLRVGKATVGELVAQHGRLVKDKGRGHTNMLIV